MKTEENPLSDSLKALKQLEGKLASSQTHDFLEDEIVVPVQNMFPNCLKYSKCCVDDGKYWDQIQKQVFRKVKLELKHEKPPEGFEGW